MDLTDKVAVVTGAARGLGRAMALALADAAVYLCRAENVTGISLNVAGGGEVH